MKKCRFGKLTEFGNGSGNAIRCCVIGSLFLLSGCTTGATASLAPFEVKSDTGASLAVKPLATFESPWAMTALPDGRLLVTEKGGTLWLVDLLDSVSTDSADSSSDPVTERTSVSGLPSVRAAGQGGLGDVMVHPDFEQNQRLYISYVERDGDLSGAVVATATLARADGVSVSLDSLEIIWRQSPKVTGNGHYGHRMAFSPDGYLFISSGERQKFDPAQDMQQNLGKVIRLHDDGSVPDDNPFAKQGGIAAQVWTLGHRNPLGIAFDQNQQLWVHEMGPRGGDELNLIVAGNNYGYPFVSNGRHYSGVPIPDHDTRADLQAPAISWTPVISPSSLVVYTGDRIPGWAGTGVIGGLSSRALVRVVLDVPATEIERYDMGARIREVEQGPAQSLLLLEDGPGGRLLLLYAHSQ